MRKNKIAIFILCLFILGIFTTACGGGGKSTPPSYPFIPVPTPTPTVSPTPEPTPTPTPEPTVSPTPAQYQLELSQTEFTVNIGETDNVTVTLNGEDITQTATYTVDEEAIATVEQGLITGLSVGIAIVTVHAENAIEDKTFTVNVIDPTLPTLEVSPTEVNLKIEKTSNVKVTLEGEDVTEKVNYKSDNESIATAEKGVVKAKDKKGSANISVSLEGANSAIFKVNVKFNEIKLDKNILALLGYERVYNDFDSNDDIKKISDGEIVKNLEIPATFTCGGTKYTITSIDSIFSNCSLESVTIPDTVTSIGYGTFSYCSSLKEIHIGDGVLWIFTGTFVGSDNLKQLTTKSGTIIDIPETGSSIGSNVTLICPKQDSSDVTGNIEIPDGITEIPRRAFYGSSLTNIKIPNTVISIGEFAFQNCSELKNITLSDSLVNIGYQTFCNCSKLESINLPDSVTSIGTGAFLSCSSLKEIHIGEGVLCIFPSAFKNCSTELTQLTTKSKKIDIPDGFHIDNDNNVTFIYVKQYREEVTGNIEIPEGVTEISYNAFYECSSLKNITIPDSLIKIGKFAFEECRSLESVTFGENSSLTTIGNSAFFSCFKLENITIPDSVISIGTEAFEGCSSLKSVTFGENSNLTIIGLYAFYNYNPSLLTLDIPNSVTTIGEDAFKNVNNVNISEAQKKIKGYSSKWGALHVNGE